MVSAPIKLMAPSLLLAAACGSSGQHADLAAHSGGTLVNGQTVAIYVSQDQAGRMQELAARGGTSYCAGLAYHPGQGPRPTWTPESAMLDQEQEWMICDRASPYGGYTTTYRGMALVDWLGFEGPYWTG